MCSKEIKYLKVNKCFLYIQKYIHTKQITYLDFILVLFNSAVQSHDLDLSIIIFLMNTQPFDESSARTVRKCSIASLLTRKFKDLISFASISIINKMNFLFWCICHMAIFVLVKINKSLICWTSRSNYLIMVNHSL